jgi:DNA-binding NarL/FixJ family response regulator
MTQLQCVCRSAVEFMVAGNHGTGNAASDSPERETGAGVNLRVLIVEDEALVAMNIESALAEAGFDVLGTVDTEGDAVAAAERMRPDVILIDITLRDGDGISAAKAIQEKLKTRIIFISGNSDPRTLAAADKINPAAFIRKPFVTDRLARLVIDAIATKS